MTLVFSTSSALISRIIRRLTSGRASHVSFGTELHGVPVLVQASVGGVQITPLEKFLARNRIVAVFRPTFDLDGAVAGAIARLGERYDYVGLVGYIPVMVARWFGRKAKNLLGRPSAMVCSELVLRAARAAARVPEWEGMDPETTTPEDLLVACEKGRSFAQLTRD